MSRGSQWHCGRHFTGPRLLCALAVEAEDERLSKRGVALWEVDIDLHAAHSGMRGKLESEVHDSIARYG